MLFSELDTLAKEQAAHTFAEECFEDAIALFTLLLKFIDHEEAGRGLLAKKQAYENAKLEKSRLNGMVVKTEEPEIPTNVGLTDEYLSFMHQVSPGERKRELTFEEAYCLWRILKVAIEQKRSSYYQKMRSKATDGAYP